MPNPHPIPESELPPADPSRNFFYCPNPLEMTDEELEREFPREVRHEFWRGLARLVERTERAKQLEQPITPVPASVEREPK